MTPEDTALARRAVACKGWRWMPGMSVLCEEHGFTWPDRIEYVTQIPDEIVCPDLTDPATLGCLLALVREAWSKPAVTMFWGDYWQVVYASKVEDGCAEHEHLGNGDTEVEALVAALEGAP